MLYRGDDPDTSKEGGDDVGPRLNALCREFLSALRTMKQATANEVAAAVRPGKPTQHSTIRRRASDLVRLGYIKIDCVRVCRESGKQASAYVEVQK